MCGLKYGPKLEEPLKRERERERSKTGQSRSQNSTTLKGREVFTSLIRMMESMKKRIKCAENIRISDGCGYALQKGKKSKKSSSSPPQETERRGRKPCSTPKTKHACIVEAHESTRQRLESSLPKITKTTLQAKDILL